MASCIFYLLSLKTHNSEHIHTLGENRPPTHSREQKNAIGGGFFSCPEKKGSCPARRISLAWAGVLVVSGVCVGSGFGSGVFFCCFICICLFLSPHPKRGSADRFRLFRWPAIRRPAQPCRKQKSRSNSGTSACRSGSLRFFDR